MSQNLFCSILSAFLFLFSITSFGQKDDYINYYRNIEKAYTEGVFAENNDSIIFYMKTAFTYVEEPWSEDYFVLANAYLGLDEKRQYFQFLLKSIEAGLDSAELNKANSYSFLNKNQKTRCIYAYDNYSFDFDTVLSKEMELIRAEDRRVRKEKQNFSSIVDWEAYVEVQDSITRAWFDTVIKTKGWPGRRVIGNNRGNVLLVHMSMEWIKRNHTLLVMEIKKGNLNPAMLAYKYDLDSFMRLKEGIIYDSFIPKGFKAKEEGEPQRRVKRWEIGALSRKVFEARNFKYRKWKVNSESI